MLEHTSKFPYLVLIGFLSCLSNFFGDNKELL
jgi:hypothetical protein